MTDNNPESLSEADRNQADSELSETNPVDPESSHSATILIGFYLALFLSILLGFILITSI